MKRIIISMVALVGWAAPAFADLNVIPDSLTLDFRTDAWESANFENFHTVGNVKATAQSGGSLWQDSVDGLGIRGGEDDEVDLEEILRIDIYGGMNLAGVWITDIFKKAAQPYNGEGGLDGVETGSVLVNDLLLFNFAGYWDEQVNNGELYVSFGQVLNVTSLSFSSSSEGDDEYSVAGAIVPLPGAVLLGVLGLGYAGLKLRRLV